MKTLKYPLAAFGLCFLLGIALVSLSPPGSQAGDQQECNWECYQLTSDCESYKCDEPKVDVWRCYQPLDEPGCEGPYNCGCAWACMLCPHQHPGGP
jgi:hypothetical protein